MTTRQLLLVFALAAVLLGAFCYFQWREDQARNAAAVTAAYVADERR